MGRGWLMHEVRVLLLLLCLLSTTLSTIRYARRSRRHIISSLLFTVSTVSHAILTHSSTVTQ